MQPTRAKLFYIRFFPSDWLSDERLRCCTLEARGLWIDMLCLMAKADRFGYLCLGSKPIGAEEISRIAGIPIDKTQELLKELELLGVFSEQDGVIYSRRLLREAEVRNQGWERLKRFRNANETPKKRGELELDVIVKVNNNIPSQKDWFDYALELKWDKELARSAYDYYESVGWLIGGKTKIADWKAVARNCQRRNISKAEEAKPKAKKEPVSPNYSPPLYKIMGYKSFGDWKEAGCPTPESRANGV